MYVILLNLMVKWMTRSQRNCICFVFHEQLLSLVSGNDSIMGGHVMSVSASPSLGDDIDPPIKIVLNNNNVSTTLQQVQHCRR